MGVEVRESPVSTAEFEEMKRFVSGYLEASIENEGTGGRMRWYPWHSASYRFNHILNVVEIAADIAASEGANVDVVRVAALFHDVSKLEAEQDLHAEAGAHVAREFLESHGDYPESFVDEVCTSVSEHSYQGPLDELPLETRCLIEADLLDKIGANGAVLLLLRMGYESRTHMDAAEMIGRVLERGRDAQERIESDHAESLIHQRLKRVKWLREWLDDEIAGVGLDSDE
ncbi:metal dependent phosphohydrolase [Halococcus morrhuae DSM 1307]|uniref:Metal dependent phosphohydrolase n=1 Tax=Halococcus morrhuae DSM 1307 TaxID=931277 RepID=M0ML03_HALMO|nr:HD domain-containing protein [Halococcus morrhuae]EMA46351.1 metal dependent phosphohydrolase [Halococcus morrhuae DSM 1307]